MAASGARDGSPRHPRVRDHRYRLGAIAQQLTGARVLDVGTFDGFYAFLAERRGAARVMAVDNEQYVGWIRRRFGIELVPGAGFRAIAELLNSGVVYRPLDALDVGQDDPCVLVHELGDVYARDDAILAKLCLETDVGVIAPLVDRDHRAARAG